MTGIQPKQKVSKNQKDSAWYKSNTDYWINRALEDNGQKEYLETLYRFVSGDVNKNDYSYVLNPYAVPDTPENKKLTKFPARLRNYNIILPMIKMHMGEAIKRVEKTQVISVNSEAENTFKEGLNDTLVKSIAQMFVNRLNELGVDTKVETKKVPTIEEIKKRYTLKYDDNRAKFGQEALDYIKYHQSLKDKYIDAFYHWLVTGEVYTYRNIYKGEVEIEVVSPLEGFPVGNPVSGLYEDCDAFVRVRTLSIAQILDDYNDLLTDEQIERLDEKLKGVTDTAGTVTRIKNAMGVMESTDPVMNSYLVEPEGHYNVYVVEWMGMKKVGVLYYYNDLGQVDKREVDETYRLDKSVGDIKVEWEWINVRHESLRISDDIYPEKGLMKNGGREGLVQRNEVSNLAPCKLNFNGIASRFPSIAADGVSYQVLYNILHYRFELTLAKHKDKIVMMPLGLVPKKYGWDEDKFMYYAEATGYGFYDETAPNAAVAIQGIKILDGGLSQYAAQMLNLLNSIKQEYWDSVGMNRQRYGESQASDGKAVTEQAIFRSAIFSEELHQQFGRLKRSDYACALDYSKMAWIDGKRSMYINSDGRQAFLELFNPVQHLETEYGIHIADGGEEQDKLNMMKSLAQPFAQNGTLSHILAEVIDANNMSRVKELLKKADIIQQDFQAQQAQADRDSNEKIAANNLEAEKIRDARERYKIDEENKTKIKVAAINQIGFGNLDESQVPDLVSILQGISEQETGESNAQIDAMREVGRKESEDKGLSFKYASLNAKEKSDATKLEIAKQNKNRYDKK